MWGISLRSNSLQIEVLSQIPKDLKDVSRFCLADLNELEFIWRKVRMELINIHIKIII